MLHFSLKRPVQSPKPHKPGLPSESTKKATVGMCPSDSRVGFSNSRVPSLWPRYDELVKSSTTGLDNFRKWGLIPKESGAFPGGKTIEPSWE